MSETSKDPEDETAQNAKQNADLTTVLHHSSQSQVQERVDGSCVEYYGAGVNYCGYCKRDEVNSEGRKSYDMKAYRLKASDYQELLDRGWRRSGNYCYHPININTCCPNYPISCKATKFKFTRSLRLCIENLNSFLVYGSTHIKLNLNYNLLGSENSTNQPMLTNKTFEELKVSSKARDKRFVRSCERKVRLYNVNLDEAIRMVKERSGRERMNRPLLEHYLYPKKESLAPQSNLFQVKHRLEIQMRHVESKESQAMRNDEHELIKIYQKDIHKENEGDWTKSRYCHFLVNSPLIAESIQNLDYVSESENSDTLSKNVCTDPSEYLLVRPPELPTSCGTYHCTYHLDGKLIAVGVLDILPKCITTVYFFYDPAYGKLNLGIYSALVEISMVRQMSKHYIGPPEENKLIHYYMGFYVHESKKMHYKTRFLPSYLLCSETYQYVPTEVCLKKLEGKKYAKFSTDSTDNDNNIFKQAISIEDILRIPVILSIINGTRMIDYIRWLGSNLGVEYADIFINNVLVQYSILVGRSLLPKLSLKINSIHRELVERHQRMAINNSSDPKSKSNNNINEHD